jgi:hypothetical protein
MDQISNATAQESRLTQPLVGRSNLGKRNLVQSSPAALDDGHSRFADNLCVRWRDGYKPFRSVRLLRLLKSLDKVDKTNDKTTPLNLDEPTRSSFIKLSRASFLPEHFRGSQWLKSHIAMATRSISAASSPVQHHACSSTAIPTAHLTPPRHPRPVMNQAWKTHH